MLHSTSSVSRHGDTVKLSLFCCLHNGFCYIKIGRNRCGDREAIFGQFTFREAFGNCRQVPLILLFDLRSYLGLGEGITWLLNLP